MAYKTIILKKEGHIATMLLNRPRRLNAMNELMWAEMSQALEEVARNEEIRVLVITGVGRAFCVGADVRADAEGERLVGESTPMEMYQGLSRGGQGIVRRLQHLEIPVIAMVNGDAVGGGFDWALACDMRIGSEKARFMVAFTHVGLIPGAGGAWFMTRAMGAAKAAEYIFSGDFISAQEAERLGILNRVVPHENLEAETMALARRLASRPPHSLRLAKILIRQAQETGLDTALSTAAIYQGVCVSTLDHQEGLAAFREKREPVFRGK